MPESKRSLNTATHELNSSITTKMIASKHSTDCSLWKATKKIKQVKKPPPLGTSQ
jgi:hypothetical protein